MKSFFIKLGKALNVVKRDGLIYGGKRIVSSFFKIFRRVGSGDILFITSGIGDSARYRAHHQAEELNLHGFKCGVTVQDNPLLPGYADKFKIFIFHRTLYTGAVIKLIKKIKKQNKEIIFETDDLLFDPQYLKYADYLKNINILEKKLYKNGLGGKILNDPYVKVCVTTTSYLAEKLRNYGKKVFLSTNKLSNRDLKIINKLQTTNYKLQANVRIGYFSGTISHNRDFATITSPLMEIMEKYPRVELFLAGPLDVDNELNKFGNRIKQLPYVPREKHFENVAGVDINLAPLEIENPFSESKSELKFFEAGILGIPTVASATRTLKEAVTDGVDGFTAGSDEGWREKLEMLINSRELRVKIGEKAREKSLKFYTNKNSSNEKYYGYLREVLKR